MAGNYMDAPAPRLAYDRDGSIGTRSTLAGTTDALSASDMQALNDEAETGPGFSSMGRLAIVFSELVDLKAIFLAMGASTVLTIQTSKDTTTGIDGTWTTQVASGASYLRDVRPMYRIAANLISMLPGSESQGVRGIRFVFAQNTSITFRALHIYGNVAASATPDRLSFRQAGADAEVVPSYFDWGNVPRATSADKTFRIKNLSGTKIAKGVEVFPEALTPGTPSVPSMLMFSTDGTTFLPSVSLGDMDPGEISPVITVRRVVPSNAQVSVWSARLVADADTWE